MVFSLATARCSRAVAVVGKVPVMSIARMVFLGGLGLGLVACHGGTPPPEPEETNIAAEPVAQPTPAAAKPAKPAAAVPAGAEQADTQKPGGSCCGSPSCAQKAGGCGCQGKGSPKGCGG